MHDTYKNKGHLFQEFFSEDILIKLSFFPKEHPLDIPVQWILINIRLHNWTQCSI